MSDLTPRLGADLSSLLRAGRSHNFIAECEQRGPHGKLYGHDDQWNAASF